MYISITLIYIYDVTFHKKIHGISAIHKFKHAIPLNLVKININARFLNTFGHF